MPLAANQLVFAGYLRCYREPAAIHAVCEDCRAAASLDLDHNAADAERRVEVLLLAALGREGHGRRLYDVLEP